MSVPNDSMPPSDPSAVSSDERQWAMFSHLSMIASNIITGAIGGFIGPLIMWLVKKDTMPWAGEQAKEVLNFSILVTAIMVAMWLLTVVTFGIGGLLAFPVMVIVGIGALVFNIIAAMKTNEGVAYRYPINFRIIK
jgi:uncharacterized Tic20 family protein